MNYDMNSELPTTIGQALQYCSDALEASDACFGHGTDNAWDEAAQLVLAVAQLPLDGEEIEWQRPLDGPTLARIDELLHRRIAEHLPLPYLLGRAWFAGLEFLCDQRAIIPRSPIAELILNGFQPWYLGPPPRRVLDLCCGGGCIGLAVAHYYPDAQVDLVDIDNEALALARENASYLGVQDRVNIRQSDLFDALATGEYDLIISNPPYVDAQDLASMPAAYHHEPACALGAGADGLDITRRILARAGPYLRDGGLLVVEVGNSWPALEAAYPNVPFTWVDFEHGGEGVFALTAPELEDYRTSWRD